MWFPKSALAAGSAIVLYVPMTEFSNASVAVPRRDYSGNGLDLTDNETIESGTTLPIPRGANIRRANSEYLSRVSTPTLDIAGNYSEVVMIRANSTGIRQVLAMKYNGVDGYYTSIEASNRLGLANAAGAVTTGGTAVTNTSSPMLLCISFNATSANFKVQKGPFDPQPYTTLTTSSAAQDFWFGRISATFTNSEFGMLALWKNYALNSSEMDAMFPAFYGSGQG